MADPTTPAPVIVPVRSAFLSRTNWAAAATAIGATITQFSPLLPPKYQGIATAIVAVIGSLVVLYQRTYGTATVTPQSVSQASSAVAAMQDAGIPAHQITDTLNALQVSKAKEQAS